MNAAQQIAKALENFFAEQDALTLESQITWAMKQATALRAFKASAKYQELRKKGAWGLYERLHAIAGGKTWYQVLTQGDEDIAAFCAKAAKNTAQKRNARIAAKLDAAGVTEVTSAQVEYCPDGFNGVFQINGDRTVTVQSILAGGHNIQCLHQRVLVKVSK